MTPAELGRKTAEAYFNRGSGRLLERDIAAAIRDAVAAEREACAVLAESWAFSAAARGANPANNIAAAIRARK